MENRLVEIRRTESIFQYIPTQNNSADIATRGLEPQEVADSELWWQSPERLRKNKQDWPIWNPETKVSRVSLSLVTAVRPTGLVEFEI